MSRVHIMILAIGALLTLYILGVTFVGRFLGFSNPDDRE